MFGENQARYRRALALSLSLVLHFSLAALILSRVHQRTLHRPIEISISGGASGAASTPGGAEGVGAGPMRPEPPVAGPAEERRARPARRIKPLERSRPAPSRPPSVQGFQGVEASVEEKEAVRAGPAVNGGPGAPARPGAPSASAGGEPGGPAGSHFSVSGAGAGGAGRSYVSILEWTRRYLSALRRAYDSELRNHPGLRGVVVVRYEILASGAVGDVRLVSTDLADHGLERSVLGQIREWRYPPEPSGDVVVTWPLRFEPPG
jgi:TonB family protein